MSRLIGAAPGYVGFEEGGTFRTHTEKILDTNWALGQLTEAVRRKPYGKLLSLPLLGALLNCFRFLQLSSYSMNWKKLIRMWR